MTQQLAVSLRKDFVEVEDGAGYLSFSAQADYCGAGQWQAIWPSNSAAAQALVASRAAGEDPCRWGVVVREVGSPTVVFSGPLMQATLSEGTPQGYARDSVTALGMSDTGILAGYLGFMTPGTDVPTTAGTNATAYYTATGTPAETVLLEVIRDNVGGDAIARREVAQMLVPASLGRGPSVTAKLRFTDLLEFVYAYQLRTEVGVRLVQGGRGELLVEPVIPQNRPGLVWSVAAGTLSGAAWTWQAVEATDVIAGGRDELTSRSFVRSSATAPSGGFGFRRERFTAQTNVEDAADLKAAADERLTEGAFQDSIALEPVDSINWRYGVDYELGDTVQVTVGGQTVTDRIWSLSVSHSDNRAPVWRPVLGELSTKRQSVLVRRIARSLAQQIRA